MVREKISDAWRTVSWDEAIGYAAKRLREIQTRYGAGAIGGITSSRCTNEETYLVQKMVRAAFGNNNVDTCARVCHSPTGYGLKTTLGTSAGTQDFDSVLKADVILVIGCNPTDGHPVFASLMKRRLRQGAKLIVADPRTIDLVRTPHIEAMYHLPLLPGTNVALINAFAHVALSEGLAKEDFVRERCEWPAFELWKKFILEERNSPEAAAKVTGVPAEKIRAAARVYATGGNAVIYYGLGVTEHSQGSTMVLGMANLAMATGNLGREGVGVNPLRGQNNVQGSCDMGSFPHELPGYRHIADAAMRGSFETAWGVQLDPEPGLRIPNMFDAALDGSFRGLYVQGEDIAQSDPNTHHVTAALGAMECVIVHDIFFNETAKYAHVFLPGSSFLEKDGTFTNSERRISCVRKVMPPLAGKADWEVTCELSTAFGYPMHYAHPSEIMDEIARLTPTFAGRQLRKARPSRLRAMAVQRPGARGHAGDACRAVRARQGPFRGDRIRSDRRESRAALPAHPYHRADPLAVQRRHADPAHRQRRVVSRGRARDSSARRRGARRARRRVGQGQQPRRRDHACARK